MTSPSTWSRPFALLYRDDAAEPEEQPFEVMYADEADDLEEDDRAPRPEAAECSLPPTARRGRSRALLADGDLVHRVPDGPRAPVAGRYRWEAGKVYKSKRRHRPAPGPGRLRGRLEEEEDQKARIKLHTRPTSPPRVGVRYRSGRRGLMAAVHAAASRSSSTRSSLRTARGRPSGGTTAAKTTSDRTPTGASA